MFLAEFNQVVLCMILTMAFSFTFLMELQVVSFPRDIYLALVTHSPKNVDLFFIKYSIIFLQFFQQHEKEKGICDNTKL
jgi:ABC-type arginine/histidine transport system permease subunit